jgi:hypothetical protein
MRRCGSYTNAAHSSSPDPAMTKIQPGTPEWLCRAQNIYRTVEGPRRDGLAKTVQQHQFSFYIY